MEIYPLSYSIPEDLFIETDKKFLEFKKEYVLSPLIPGNLDTYIYNDEASYYDMYRKSKFGITHKKVGWDCLRHYEILANKCIPYFHDLKKCPINTMTTFPKDLINEVNEKCTNGDLRDEEYNIYLNKIYDYAKNNMTCRKNAEYFLNIISKNTMRNNIKILMLVGQHDYKNVNYTRELLAIGLRRTLGSNFIDYPKISVLYDDCVDKEKYIGKGFTYGGRLKDENINRDDIENRIKNKEFDFIVYGKVGKKIGKVRPPYIDKLDNLQYWNVVSQHYDKTQIVFIYGGDSLRNINNDCLQLHAKHGICFVRELQ